MADEPVIPPDDRERIEDIVKQFRTRIENLYAMAYLQGAIDTETKERDKLKARVAA